MLNPKRRPEAELNPHASQWVVQALTRLFSTYAILQGLGIITGGRIRWSANAYRDALTVPGAPTSWGVVLLAFGILTLATTFRPRHRVITVGMGLTAAWHGVFALFFASSAFRDHASATTPIWIYGTVGVACGVLAAAYWQSRP